LKTSIKHDWNLSNFVHDANSRPLFNVCIDTYKINNNGKIIFTGDAQRSLEIDNAGGSSALSEALSIHYMSQRFKISKFILEMEVAYDFYGCSMCDYLMQNNDYRIGVSVTRAMHYKDPSMYSPEDAEKLLNKKLYGLIVARNGISEKNGFYKSILHIWCQNQIIADTLSNIHNKILNNISNDDPIKEIVVILTICDADWIYTNSSESM